MTAKLKFKKGDLVELRRRTARLFSGGMESPGVTIKMTSDDFVDLVMVLGYQGKAIKTWRADKEMGRLWTVIEPNGKKGVVWEDQLRKV